MQLVNNQSSHPLRISKYNKPETVYIEQTGAIFGNNEEKYLCDEQS